MFAYKQKKEKEEQLKANQSVNIANPNAPVHKDKGYKFRVQKGTVLRLCFSSEEKLKDLLPFFFVT